jgi:hypothetical protein
MPSAQRRYVHTMFARGCDEARPIGSESPMSTIAVIFTSTTLGITERNAVSAVIT